MAQFGYHRLGRWYGRCGGWDSARSIRTVHDHGQTVVTIEHAPLSGMSPRMLAWWYGHVRGTMRYAGTVYPRYLVWRPLDHVSYTMVRPAAEPVGPGSRLHIVEALGRDPAQILDIRVEVERLDDQVAVVSRRVLGSPSRVANREPARPANATPIAVTISANSTVRRP